MFRLRFVSFRFPFYVGASVRGGRETENVFRLVCAQRRGRRPPTAGPKTPVHPCGAGNARGAAFQTIAMMCHI